MAILTVDPEYAAAVAPMAEVLAAKADLAVGDALGRREVGERTLKAFLGKRPLYPEVTRTDHRFPAADGHTLTLSEFRKEEMPSSSNEKVIFFIHGGGFILGSVDLFETGMRKRVVEYGVPVFGVHYRLAPEHKHPVPVEDCFWGLKWLSANSGRLGVDRERIVAWGESAGGGLAAGMALMARDQNFSPPIAKQILMYPMIDDRNNTPLPGIEDHATWNCNDNITGWKALIGEHAGSLTEDVPPYAAPARATDLRGLPATYIEVGQLDIFVHENLAFASRLAAAEVPVELHVYPGMPHGFTGFAPSAAYSKMAMANIAGAVERA